MKHIILLCLTIVILNGITSCDYIKNYDSPHLELINQTPYTLNVTNFPWTYGVVAINQFGGNFDKLDEKVYNILKGKNGQCEVYMQLKSTDKYGNSKDTLKYAGTINIDELNKFQDWHYWQLDGGIRKLIYTRIMWKRSQMADSAAVTTIDTTKHQSPAVSQPAYTPVIREGRRVYNFSEMMLYPTEEDRKDLDSARFKINGTIEDVNFTNGVMQIQTKTELLDVQFYALDMSSDVNYKLRLALENGNYIMSVCARAGASTLDLVSCTIIGKVYKPKIGDTVAIQ